MNRAVKGRIHSFQSLGAVDGPGLRFVVFMQGCQLRCAYCHNPDTWDRTGGEVYEIDEVVKKILRCKPYFAENGGVTVSGGEPLLQCEFVEELFRRLKEEGIHTALDTSGIGPIESARQLLRYTDLVLCDLKFSNEEDYQHYTGGHYSDVIEFLELTESIGMPLRIRHVIVPGLTDGPENILRIGSIASRFSNLQKVELLPFRKLCVAKYQAMGIEFPLKDYKECPDDTIIRANERVRNCINIKNNGFR